MTITNLSLSCTILRHLARIPAVVGIDCRQAPAAAALSLMFALALFPGTDASAQTQENLPVATVSDISVDEGDAFTFTVRLDRPVSVANASFDYRLRGVTAASGADFSWTPPQLKNSWTASLSRGDTSYTIHSLTYADELVEGDETFEVVLSNPVGLTLGDTTATATIRDEDTQVPTKPEIALFDGSGAVEGGRVFFQFSIHPRLEAPLDVWVDVSQQGGYAYPWELGRRKVTIGTGFPAPIIIHTQDNAVNEPDGTIIATLVPNAAYTIDGRRRGPVAGRRSTATVTDNDPPSVTISAGPSVQEGGTARFTLKASPRPASSLSVEVDVSESGDMAASGQSGRRIVTIGSNGQATLNVRTDSDGVDEADSVISASVVRAHRYGVGSPGTARVVVSDGGTPTPRISIAPGPGIQEGDTASFTLTADPAPETSIVVSVDVTEDGRYTASGQTGARRVTIGTDGTATLGVATVSDERDEADGTIRARVVAGQGYAPGAPSSAVVGVTDGGTPTPTVHITAGPAVQEGGTANFHVWASPKPEQDMQVAVDVTDSGNLAARSQTGRRIVTVYTTGWGNLSVLTDKDDKDDPDGHITATIAKVGESYALGSPRSARVDVTDGGAPTPRISIAPAVRSVHEGEAASFVLTASPPPASSFDASVKVSATGRFVQADQVGVKTVSIDRTGTGVLKVATVTDAVDERDGAILAELRAGRGYEIAAPSSSRVEVTDGGVPTRRVSIVPGPDVVEGETASFEITAVPAPQAEIEVSLRVSDSGGVAWSDQTGTRKVTVGSDGTATLLVETQTDSNETGGTVTASVASGPDYAVGSPASATLRVADGDSSAPVVSIDPGSTIMEGEGAVFTVRANPAPASSLAVHLSVTQRGSFLLDEDLPGPVTAVIDSSGTGTVSLPTHDDDRDERQGSITASIADDASYVTGLPRYATYQVLDNDVEENTPAVSVGDASLVEGDRASLSRMSFPVTLSHASTERVTVRYALFAVGETAGTRPATPGRDFDLWGLGSSWVVLDPGETEVQAHVRIIDDDEEEKMPERFGLRIIEVRGAEIADGLAVGTIQPDPWDSEPGTPVITISAQAAVTEGEAATFTLIASPPAEEDIAVTITIRDATETDRDNEDGDFVAEGNQGTRTVTFLGVGRQAAVLDSTAQTFTVATVDDDVDETTGPLTAIVEVPDDGRYVSESPYEASVIVYDNDGSPDSLPALSVADATANESDGQIHFEVTLDPPAPDHGTVTVLYGTYNGTARAGEDFVARHGTLTFLNGEDLKTVSVDIIDDGHDDPGETFLLSLFNPEGAEIADQTGTGTIVNSDPMPREHLAHAGHSLASGVASAVRDRAGAARPSLGVTPGLDGTSAEVGTEGGWATWTRATGASFGADSLSGDARRIMLGADLDRGDGLLLGVMAVTDRAESESRGQSVETDTLAVVPYAAIHGTWAALGAGAGDLSLVHGAETMEAGTEWLFAGAGWTDGSVSGDAFWQRMSSDAAEGLAAAEGETWRLRLGWAGHLRADADAVAFAFPVTLRRGRGHPGGVGHRGRARVVLAGRSVGDRRAGVTVLHGWRCGRGVPLRHPVAELAQHAHVPLRERGRRGVAQGVLRGLGEEKSSERVIAESALRCERGCKILRT